MVQGGRRLVGALVVLGAGASAESHSQLAVPARSGCPRGCSRFGIVKDSNAIDGAVDSSGIDAHDVGDGLSFVGRRGHQVGGPRRANIKRLEDVAGSAVEVYRLGDGGTVAVERFPQP